MSHPGWVGQVIRAGVIAGACFLGALVLTSLLRRIAWRLGSSVEPRSAFARSVWPLRAWLVLLGVYYAASEISLGGRLDRIVDGVFYVAATLMGIMAVARLTTFLLTAYLAHGATSGGERFEREYLPLTKKVIGVAVATVGLLIGFRHFGIDVTALITTLGVGGLAVGFAARETLSNMIAGFTILIDRPFRPGDRIRLASGETGDVLEIGIRSTRIRLLDQNLLVVPNADLTNTRIVNYNLPTPLGQGAVEVRVAYGANLVQIEQILLELVGQERQVVLEPKPSVILKRFGENGLDLQITFFVSQFTDAGGIENRLRTALYKRFGEQNITIPVAQRDVRMLDKR